MSKNKNLIVKKLRNKFLNNKIIIPIQLKNKNNRRL